MTAVESLVLDLLEWIGPSSRPYGEVIDAWRTSCPRFPVWEDATDRGFVELRQDPNQGMLVFVTPLGLRFLQEHRSRDD